jgi:hypothetical protein
MFSAPADRLAASSLSRRSSIGEISGTFVGSKRLACERFILAVRFGISMTRIFTTLATLDGFLLTVSYALGWVSRWEEGIHHPENRIYWLHFLFGLTTALLTLLVHCLIFTYFLGTGRWVKEVKLAYNLSDAPLPKLTRDLKRRVFPPALFAMLFAAATGAAGAAAHVGVSPWFLHATLATLTLAVNLWAFVVEYGCLRTNVRVLDDVLVEVDRIRAARGLPPNVQALRNAD